MTCPRVRVLDRVLDRVTALMRSRTALFWNVGDHDDVTAFIVVLDRDPPRLRHLYLFPCGPPGSQIPPEMPQQLRKQQKMAPIIANMTKVAPVTPGNPPENALQLYSNLMIPLPTCESIALR